MSNDPSSFQSQLYMLLFNEDVDTHGRGYIVNIRRGRHFTLTKLPADNYFMVLCVTGCAGCAILIQYVEGNRHTSMPGFLQAN